MSYVVTITGVVPPERSDSTPWTQARIEEGPDPAGPWTQLILVNPLSPVEPDPTNPMVRNFTVNDALLAAGWYRVTFLDAIGNSSSPTPPIGGAGVNYLPSRTDVGALLRARTKDSNMNEQGTFTSMTRPTGEQSDILIFRATRDIANKIGGTVPTVLIENARTTASYLAAALIELSYWPEQVQAGQMSAYDKYISLYKDSLKDLNTAIDVEGGTAAEPGAVPGPSYSYPENTGIGLGTEW